MRALRQSLSPEQVRSAGTLVARAVLGRTETARSSAVCVYVSTGKEVPTDTIIKGLLEAGSTVAVPDWEGWKQGSGLRTVAIRSLDDLDGTARVVPQPVPVDGNLIPVDAIDLFIVPGLAFDPQGNRIGMGGGYFDRLLALASSTATFLGLAYDFQVISHLNAEDHDVCVHDVVTPGLARARGFTDKQEGMEYGT